MPTVKRLPTRPLRSNLQPRLFDSDAQRHLRQVIKTCVRSGYAWTRVERSILKDLMEDVDRFGRLASPKHKLLLVFAKKCGVTP